VMRNSTDGGGVEIIRPKHLYPSPALLKPMGRRPYRVEMTYPKDRHRKPQYYLAKDVWFKGKKGKVKKYLGTTPPSEGELEKYRKEHAYEIELKAALKKAHLSSKFYESDYLTNRQIKSLEEIRFVYKTFTELLTTNEINAYERKFEVTYVQGTTSIEGNTLSVGDAYDLLVNGILPEEKTLREINEVQNFIKVKEYRGKYKQRITINFIKNLHSLIMDNIDFESAGIFRRADDICIVGCDLRVSPSIMIKKELEENIEEYYSRIDGKKHPFEEAALFHYNFEMIHPFTNGNGRVGREIFNYMLNRSGYPKLLFLGKDRDAYIKYLHLGNEENYGDMIDGFASLITSQRMDKLKENLKKVVIPIEKTGQMRLTDFL